MSNPVLGPEKNMGSKNEQGLSSAHQEQRNKACTRPFKMNVIRTTIMKSEETKVIKEYFDEEEVSELQLGYARD